MRFVSFAWNFVHDARVCELVHLISATMPLESLAHFKHRAPFGTGPCNEQMPPSKRACESLVGERVRSSLPEDEKKFTTGNTVSPDEKTFVRRKTSTDAESVTRGNYDISDTETLKNSNYNSGGGQLKSTSFALPLRLS